MTSTTKKEKEILIPTASCQFYEQLVEELAEHARNWLGMNLSHIRRKYRHRKNRQHQFKFTAAELDKLLIKNRPDGKNERDILKLLQTQTENKTKPKELNQLYYIQNKLTYQLRTRQQFVTEGIDTSKQQELKSVTKLINLILSRRTTDTETTTTTTTKNNTIDVLNDVLNVDGESSTLDDGSTPSTLGGTTNTMNTMNTSNTPSSPSVLDGTSVLDGSMNTTNTSSTINTSNTANTSSTTNTSNTPSTPSTSSNSNKLQKTNVIHETIVLSPLTQLTYQLLIKFFQSMKKTFTIESICSNSKNMSTEDQLGQRMGQRKDCNILCGAMNPSPEDQLGQRKDFNILCSVINPSPSYNKVERWKDGKLIQIRLNKLKYYRFGR